MNINDQQIFLRSNGLTNLGERPDGIILSTLDRATQLEKNDSIK